MDRTLIIMVRQILTTLKVTLIACILVLAIVLFPRKPEPITFLENIHGIPFTQEDGQILISENLAHTDVYLSQPTLARVLSLDLTFSPGNLDSLAVGVRENSFWLSYPQINIWQSPPGESIPAIVTRHVEIPLTDKLADADQSIDLMFFAVPSASASEPTWTLIESNIDISYAWPSYAAVKDAIKSIVYRERLL